MAEEKDIDALRELSRQIDDLYDVGKDDDAAALLEHALIKSKATNQAYFLFFQGEKAGYIDKDYKRRLGFFNQALSKNPGDYFLLRSKGVSLSTLDREEEAIALFDQALTIKADDYDSLRQKGVSLSMLSREDEAIAFFDQALAIKADDYNSLREKGVSLSNLGRMEEAIAFFDQALAINADDYQSLRGKGVSLSKLDREEEAIAFFDQALAIKADDYLSLRNKGVSLFNKGMHEDALKYVEKAYQLKPSDKSISGTYEYIRSYLAKGKRKKRKPEKEQARITEKEEIKALRGVVQKIRDEMKDKVNRFLTQMQEREQKRTEFLSKDSLLDAGQSFLLLLRKWNSFTPIIPTKDDERYVGGGYYIYHKGVGTVIDPGYNFIENFYRAGCRITDIHNIILTHAHNDHTNDFESLLSLLYQYNRKNKFEKETENFKKINVYMNAGSFKKFAGLIDLRGSDYIDRLYPVSPGDQFTLCQGVKLHILQAYHDELISKKYAIGLKFSIKTDQGAKNILITSDTGLFPQKKSKSQNEDVADVTKPEIWETYGLDEEPIHLLIVHIGSIRKDEFEASIDTENEKIFYPNHLGIIGSTRVIASIHPKLAIVSEFGEELFDFQEDLINVINNVIKAYFQGEDCPTVLPGDLPLIYSIPEESIYCILCQKMVPATNVTYTLPGKVFYYYDSSIMDPQKIAKAEKFAFKFESSRKDKKGLYFKQKV